MKLRNKKTGDVWDFDGGFSMHASHKTAERAGARSGSLTCYANSLAKLNAEWEDYEEPKEFWFINDVGEIEAIEADGSEEEQNSKEIGNHFSTKEEAELAVEKLKAYKRLRDKGFRFKCCDDYHIDYELTGKCAWTDETEADLDLLFRGEG